MRIVYVFRNPLVICVHSGSTTSHVHVDNHYIVLNLTSFQCCTFCLKYSTFHNKLRTHQLNCLQLWTVIAEAHPARPTPLTRPDAVLWMITMPLHLWLLHSFTCWLTCILEDSSNLTPIAVAKKNIIRKIAFWNRRDAMRPSICSWGIPWKIKLCSFALDSYTRL